MEFLRNIHYNKRFFLSIPFIALMVSALVFPQAYFQFKIPLLFFSLIISFVMLMNEKNRSIFKIFLLPAIYCIISGYTVLTGIFKSNAYEAIYDYARLNMLYPFLIVLFWYGASKVKSFNFHKTLVFSTYVISILMLSLVISEYYGIDIFGEEFSKENLYEIGIHPGYIQINAYCIGSMLFISGYLLHYIFFRKSNIKDCIPLFFAMLVVILSSRRAIQLLVLASPMIFLITCYFLKNKYPVLKIIKIFATLFTLGFIFILVFSGFELLDFNEVFKRLIYVLEDDDNARIDQYYSLLDGFAHNFIFGSGAGGGVSVIRSVDSPWVYELTYMQLLFNNGIVGTSFIFSFLLYYIYILLKNNKDIQKIDSNFNAKFTGVLFLLFGSISNPYLGSFDFMLFAGTISLVELKNRC
jgi:hypothetical protein